MTREDDPNPELLSLDKAVAGGDFDRVRDIIRRLGPDAVEQLEAQIGSGVVRQLQRYSRRTRSRKRGRVVLLHGIMGSELDVIDRSGDADHVWVNYLRIMQGRFRDLELRSDGKPAKVGYRVEVTKQHKTYLPMALALSQDWHVLPFTYDWRVDIADSAVRLARSLDAWSGGEPVHLVAHSMGGLVARQFARDFQRAWRDLMDASEGRAGGHLIMMGTPNRGSYKMPLVLSGRDALIRKMAKWEFGKDSLKNIKRVVGSFCGAYQMLPSPLIDLGDSHKELYRKRQRKDDSIRQALLTRSLQFHHALHEVIDPQRMTYIAGCDQPTPYLCDLYAPGDFKVFSTRDGDGTVAHALGLLDGVKTYYVRELHGDLPKNDSVIQAVQQLLEHGETDAISSRRPSRLRRSEDTDGKPAEWADRFAEDESDFDKLLARAASKARGSSEGHRRRVAAARVAQSTLQDFLGRPGEADEDGASAASKTERPALRVRVLWSDLKECDADVVCVGHYRGVLPQYAEKALDAVLSPAKAKAEDNAPEPEGLLTSLTRRGALVGDLGEIYMYPWRDAPKRLGVVAGMGFAGEFTAFRLRSLARNLAWSVGKIPAAKRVATVLIGSGEGGLRIERALESLLDGVSDAVAEGLESTKIQEITIVEYYRDRAKRILEALQKDVDASRLGRHVRFDVEPDVVVGKGGQYSRGYARALALGAQVAAIASGDARHVEEALRWLPDERGIAGPSLRDGAREALQDLARAHRDDEAEALADEYEVRSRQARNDKIPTRISFVREHRQIRTSALTHEAVVRERVRQVDPELIQGLIDGAVDPEIADLPDLSRLLHTLLVAPEIQPGFETDSIVLDVDRFTAAIPWELVSAKLPAKGEGTKAQRYLGLGARVSRQLRTEYSPPPARPTPAAGRRRKALVVGDPDGSLIGAREEAEIVAEKLERDFEVTRLMGPARSSGRRPLHGAFASRIKVLNELSKYDYDILHFAGHGDFDAEDPTRAGWVFSDGLLTAGELAALRSVPRLVFANACLSGRVSAVASGGTSVIDRRRDSDLLPSLADEFFRRGVHNYVGTAWEVDDLGAVSFAMQFYEHLLGGRCIGDAMLTGRRALAEDVQLGQSALWLAYQHYGTPDFHLL